MVWQTHAATRCWFSGQTPDCAGKPGTPPNRFYTYGVIGRLAMLAAARELEAMREVA